MNRERDLVSQLSQFLEQMQRSLFPKIEDEFGRLSDSERKVVKALELVRIQDSVWDFGGRWRGRPVKDRKALARAFVAKATLGLPTTRALLDRLRASGSLRWICGWQKLGELPSEASFSRAFGEFAATELAQRVHALLIKEHLTEKLVGHISRDATAIRAREKAVGKQRKAEKSGKAPRRGRRRKGDAGPAKPPKRLHRQAAGMGLETMLGELPRVCDFGCKRNSDGKTEHWKGYKLHVDWADGEVPVSCVLTAASVHDSQVAIPLTTMTARRVTNLYDLMDSAYDAKEIREHSVRLGHVPIIETNSRSKSKPRQRLNPAEARRFGRRTTAERGNSRLKDEFGGRTVRVRGSAKVMAHLMFGILALTADQLLRLSG